MLSSDSTHTESSYESVRGDSHPYKHKQRRERDPSALTTFTDMTVIDMWRSGERLSGQSDTFGSIPVELTERFVCEFLSVLDLCMLRRVSKGMWACVCCHCYNTGTTVLCQGAYVATVAPLPLPTGVKYVTWGLRPGWEDRHNHQCQECGAVVSDGEECGRCFTCNVSVHLACYRGKGHWETGVFLCEECATSTETPVSGYPILLNSPSSRSRQFRHRSEAILDSNVATENNISAGSRVGCSLRLALKKSLEDLTPKTVLDGVSIRNVEWDRGADGRFTVVGGFHSSSLTSNADLYHHSPSSSIPWSVTRCLQPSVDKSPLFPVHSGNSVVCGDDIWTFPCRRDRVGWSGAGGAEVCFHRARVLAVDGSYRTGGWVEKTVSGQSPTARSGAALCFVPALSGALLHGGLAIVHSEGQNAPATSRWWHYSSADDFEDEQATVTDVKGCSRMFSSSSLYLLFAQSQTSDRSFTWEEVCTAGARPSARYGHTMTCIGKRVWMFGGMGAPAVPSEGRRRSGRQHFNDLFCLDIDSTKTSSMRWIQPKCTGNPPIRRAGHSALAFGPQLVICGGVNGGTCLSDMHLLHTPTLTWSTLKSATGESSRPLAIMSRRMRPALLPLTPNSILVFGGGTGADYGAPLFRDIPADAYVVTVLPTTRPAAII